MFGVQLTLDEDVLGDLGAHVGVALLLRHEHTCRTGNREISNQDKQQTRQELASHATTVHPLPVARKKTHEAS